MIVDKETEEVVFVRKTKQMKKFHFESEYASFGVDWPLVSDSVLCRIHCADEY